jgi:hypothetical protein
MRHFHGIQIDYSLFASIICPVMMRYHVACENKSRVFLEKPLIRPSAQETSYVFYLDNFKSFAEAATTAAAYATL